MAKKRVSKEATRKRKEELKERIISGLGYDRRGVFAKDLDHVLSKVSEADLCILMVAIYGK